MRRGHSGILNRFPPIDGVGDPTILLAEYYSKFNEIVLFGGFMLASLPLSMRIASCRSW